MNHQIWQSNGIEVLPQFLTSLAIGLLIGLERERRPSSKAGLRTFALVALLGTLTAMLSSKTDSPWLLIAGFCIVGIMIIAAYFTRPTEDNDPGTTTVAALLLCYALGALIWYEQMTLAVMLAIVTTTLLYFKPELRGMTKRLTRRDLVSILQFLILTFVILPVLPNQNYGPYEAFNPHQIWMMVVLISGLSLAGYVALHWTAQRYGAPLLGLLGGLVSSTATTLVYARHAQTSEIMARLCCGYPACQPSCTATLGSYKRSIVARLTHQTIAGNGAWPSIWTGRYPSQLAQIAYIFKSTHAKNVQSD